MSNFILSVHQIVAYLDGKKSTILAILTPTISYLVTANMITPELGSYLTTVLSVLCGGALAVGATQSYKDNKAMGKI